MRSVRAVAVFASLVALLTASTAHADKCTGAKLKALGKAEAALLTCQAKVASIGDPSSLPACETKVMTKLTTAFAKAGACVGDITSCESAADGCESVVANSLIDTFPSKCESGKRKAAGKLVKAELGCYAKAALLGIPVDQACIVKAQAKLDVALLKAGSCPDSGDVRGTVEGICVSPTVTVDVAGMVTDVCPIAATTTTTEPTASTTSTTDPTATTTSTTDPEVSTTSTTLTGCGARVPCYTGMLGVCATGTMCSEGKGTCVPDVQPTGELCDGLDNDCNGAVDDAGGSPCVPEHPGAGICGHGTTACIDGTVVCYPNQPSLELCDGLDNDCNGQADDGNPEVGFSCNTGEPGVCAWGRVTACTSGVRTCSRNQEPSTEICNGLDDDCDGETDDNLGSGESCDTGMPGVCAAGRPLCFSGWIYCYQNIQPSAEVCDGQDNDCNGQVDEGNPPSSGQACSTGMPGVCQQGTTSCSGGATSCTPNVGPSDEMCDGLDNDCDGQVDEGNPGGGESCNTGSPGLCAAGTTRCFSPWLTCWPDREPRLDVCDGLDNDCDGQVDEGNPGGGASCNTGQIGVCAAGTTACTSGAVTCNRNQAPSAEICDGLDNDCDGVTDPGTGQACNTGQPGVCATGTTACSSGAVACNRNQQPGAEICDGLDNDCDGQVDEGNPGGGVSCNTGQAGLCAAGTTACSSGALVCNRNQGPSADICDRQDNDCDGQVDEGNPGGGVSCNTGQDGVCAAGTTACSNGAVYCFQNQYPSGEVCDGLDNDCDAQVDEGNPGGGVSCNTGQAGVCAPGTTACTSGALVCNRNQAPGAEVCDTIDNDCDGQVDEGIGFCGRRVFVTSTTSMGNLGGLAGADTRCANLATAAGLTGTYKAWLSTSATGAATRLTHATVPYYLVDGVTRVANDWFSLINFGLLHAIDHDERGNAIAPSYVWTGTFPIGSGPIYDCSGWTSSLSGDINFSVAGLSSESGGGWTNAEFQWCNRANRLYCMQQ